MYTRTRFTFQQAIRQLEKRKGGYYFLKVNASTVAQFEKGRKTRLICEINDQLSFPCGLNHFGDGHFFIILSTKNVKLLKVSLGEEVNFAIYEDPNPLGVDIPEVLTVLLDQDQEAKGKFEQLTDGKKRSLIYGIQKVKDLDKQVNQILAFLEQEDMKLRKKQRV